MEAVLAEEAAVMLLDVGVAAGAVGAVVGDLALGGYSPVHLHNKINITLNWLPYFITHSCAC